MAEVAVLEERIALPHKGWFDLYEESLKAILRLPLHYLIIELLNTYQISPCNIVPNS